MIIQCAQAICVVTGITKLYICHDGTEGASLLWFEMLIEVFTWVLQCISCLQYLVTVGKWIASCSKGRGAESSGSHVFRSKHGHGHDEEESIHDSSSGSMFCTLIYLFRSITNCMALYLILTCCFVFFADTYICMGELFLFRFCCRYVHIFAIFMYDLRYLIFSYISYTVPSSLIPCCCKITSVNPEAQCYLSDLCTVILYKHNLSYDSINRWWKCFLIHLVRQSLEETWFRNHALNTYFHFLI